MYASTPENVTRLLRKILDFLIPAPCLACGELAQEPRHSLGLCELCRQRLVPWPNHGCDTCGKPLESASLPPGYRCGGCRRQPTPYRRVLSAWSYQPPLDAVLTGLKFRRLEYLGLQLGQFLADSFANQLTACDVVVPVPLYWSRYLRRGYNQAGIIARALAARLELPVAGALRRRRATPPQSRMSRAARLHNMTAAFCTRRRVSCQGRHVLLVDDVFTTGATLTTAAQCLVDAGVESVTALTAARTPEDSAVAPRPNRDRQPVDP